MVERDSYLETACSPVLGFAVESGGVSVSLEHVEHCDKSGRYLIAIGAVYIHGGG